MPFESFAHVPITEELIRHVWEGEEDLSKGGHRFGLGRLHKTEFPEHWGKEEVLSAIEITLLKPQLIRHKVITILCERVVGDVVVCVVLRKSRFGLRLHSAYPVCGSGVFRNDPQGRTLLPLEVQTWEE